MPHFITYFLLFSTLAISCSCINQNNFSQSDPDWSPAVATNYAGPNGGGNGACGYKNSVAQPPFSSFVSAGGSSLFKSGKGCGACYEVKCTENAACSGNPVTVVITDSCLDSNSQSQPVHFDMSDTAFVAMAIPGNADPLRTAGVLNVQYRRVECNYPGVPLSFGVRSGSSPYYFETLIEYVSGSGALSAVELKQASASPDSWLSMQQSWGAVWKLNDTSGLTAPFSLKLIEDSGKTLVADNVIPADWQPGKTYQSAVTSFV
nr:putative expansin-B2 [Ipomoea batatas]